jgi:threonine dehydratase
VNAAKRTGHTVRAVRTPTGTDLDQARAVVRTHLAPTPLVPVELDGHGELLVKLETLQPTGSFKVRGALAAVSAHRASAERFVTASAGNHGLGLAFAAATFGVPATIVVPRNASAAKVEALRRLGADLVEYGDSYDEAESHALGLAGDRTVFVSAYNDPEVIAGQASCTAEIREQVDGGMTLLVPVGGGGLLAGTVLAAGPDTRVIGVETAASQAMSTATRAGRLVTVPVSPTLADGLAGNLEPGSITPALAGSVADSFITVTEDEIAAAIRQLATRCGLVVEGSGAVGVAALLAGKVPVGGRTVAMLTGRNISPDVLGRILG